MKRGILFILVLISYFIWHSNACVETSVGISKGGENNTLPSTKDCVDDCFATYNAQVKLCDQDPQPEKQFCLESAKFDLPICIGTCI